MKKFLFMIALMVGVVSADAQIATQNSNALDNIGIGATFGVATPLNGPMFPINTFIGIKGTKDFTPYFGVQLEADAVLGDNHFGDIKTAFTATNIGANAVFNIFNIFGGYPGKPRIFEMNTVTGLGWLHYCSPNRNFLDAKTGLDLAFNIGKKRAHTIVVTPAIYWNLTGTGNGNIKFNSDRVQFTIAASYIYHFKTSNGTHSFKTYDIGAMISEIDRLNGALSECESRQPQVVERVVEIPGDNTTIIKTANDFWLVTFETAKADLSTEAKYILNQIGNDAIVDVVGTASEDGTAEFNQKISEERAAKVADYLTNRGVKVNSWKGVGVNPLTGRAAVVKTLQ
jgi:hypothetical protein